LDVRGEIARTSNSPHWQDNAVKKSYWIFNTRLSVLADRAPRLPNAEVGEQRPGGGIEGLGRRTNVL
jgi:hypothetical protein